MSRGNPPLAAGCGAPVMGLGFLSSLVPGFCWEYEQRHSSTGDAGHAAGCSQGSAGNLCFSCFPLNMKVLGMTIHSTL